MTGISAGGVRGALAPDSHNDDDQPARLLLRDRRTGPSPRGSSWGRGSTAPTGRWSAAIRSSGAQMVTVAVRRVDLDRSVEEGHPAPPRSRRVFPPAQHGRLLHRRRCAPLCPPGPCGGAQRLGQARGDRRRPDAAPRHRRHARRPPTNSSRKASRSWPTPTTTSSPPFASRMRGASRSCRWPVRSGAGWGWSIPTTSARSSGGCRSRSSWTPGSAPPPMRASPWSRASTGC